MRSVELAIDITSTAGTAAFDSVGRAASDMAADVASASADASSKIDAIGSSADDLDSKAGRATGALGALSAGFELAGAEKYAGALQSAAMATDFASGVGQSLTLILELESVKRAKAVAASVLHKGATLASSAATKAAAASQWALNAAMSANPIGLIVAGIALLVAGFVLAYKKSETFRDIVNGAMAKVRAGIDPVLSIVKDVAAWVGEKLPPAWETMKDGAVRALDLILAPIRTVKDAVEWIIDKVSNFRMPDIDFPDLPGWLGGGDGVSAGASAAAGLSTTGGATMAAAGGYAGPAVVVQVDGSGIVDPHYLARTLESTLSSYADRIGRRLVIA